MSKPVQEINRRLNDHNSQTSSAQGSNITPSDGNASALIQTEQKQSSDNAFLLRLQARIQALEELNKSTVRLKSNVSWDNGLAARGELELEGSTYPVVLYKT